MKLSGWSPYSDSKGHKTDIKGGPDRMCHEIRKKNQVNFWRNRRGNRAKMYCLLLCARSWAKLMDLQQEDQSLLLWFLFPLVQFCQPSWTSRLPSFFSLPYFVFSQGSFMCFSCNELPDNWRDGGLLPQMPCASVARLNAEPQFFSPIFKYQGRNLNGPHTSLWISLPLSAWPKGMMCLATFASHALQPWPRRIEHHDWLLY